MYRLAQLMPILKTLDLYQVDCVVAGGFANFLWTDAMRRTTRVTQHTHHLRARI